MKPFSNQQSFTLIELLIVIGILAILAVVVVLFINPVEYLKQTRDSKRITELQELNKAILYYQADGKTSFGSSSVVYVSIPDATSTCASLGLPALPSGWSYVCASTSTYRKVDSTGWIPINFTLVSWTTPLSILPIDPVNATSTGNYYIYVTGGSWELNTRLESNKYGYGGNASKTNSDGGNNDYLYEIGTNLALILDNENYIKDGDMEQSDVTFWGDYSYNPPPPTKEKVTTTFNSGSRSLHLVTNDAGYEGTSQGFTRPLPASGKVYVQLAYKVAPGKTFGWVCHCSNLGCCWYQLFGNKTETSWTKVSLIRDISASTGLYAAYFSQPFNTPSEFWLDDVIIRPVY